MRDARAADGADGDGAHAATLRALGGVGAPASPSVMRKNSSSSVAVRGTSARSPMPGLGELERQRGDRALVAGERRARRVDAVTSLIPGARRAITAAGPSSVVRRS